MIRNKRRWQKSEMSRTIVIYCIRLMTLVLIWAAALKTVALFLNIQLDVSDVLTYTGAAFGGELLLLAFKRIFAKKDEDIESA